MMQSRDTNIKKTCGDEELDKLIADGIIKKLETCCHHHAYGDHNLYITMQNGADIESISSMMLKSLSITVNGNIYLQEIQDAAPMISIISMFENRQPMTMPEKKYIYSKSLINETLSRQEISKDEFDGVLNQLPDAVKRVLTHRLVNTATRQMVLVPYPSNFNISNTSSTANSTTSSSSNENKPMF